MNSEDAIYVRSSRVRNTLPGTEGTYHDAVGSIDICDLDTFSERAAKKCGLSAAVVKNVIAASGAEAAELISTRLHRITDVFGIALEAAISGSVPSIDSPLTEENKVYVAAYPSPELKNAPGGIKPVRSGEGPKVTFDKVEDQESGEPGVIVGTGTFLLTGWGLSTSGEGEGIKVVSLEEGGAVAPATVSRNDNGQTVWASLAAPLPAGKAKVCVTTRGLDPDGDLWPYYRPVTILEGETPPEPVGEPSITNAKSTGFADRTVNIGGGDLTVEGENLATATEVKFLDPDGSEFYTVPVTYAGGRLVAADGTMRTEGPASGSVKVTTAGGTATLEVTFTTP